MVQESTIKKEKIDIWIKIICTIVFASIVALGAWNSDDGYHAFVMARNFANGHGFVYNIGERVNAATCPLFALVLGVLYFFTGNLPVTSMVVCTVFSVLAYCILIFGICQRRWTVVFATILLCCSSSFMSFTTAGLENSLLFLEEALFLYLICANDEYDFRKLLFMSLLCSAVLLTRLDAGIVIFFVTAYTYLFKRKCSCKKMFLAGIAGLFPFLAWEIFSVFYYGVPFPNTYYIKVRTGYPLGDYITKGVEYFFVSWGYDTILITVILLVLVMLLINRQMKYRLLGIGIFLKMLYLLYVGGDFMIGRHFTDLFFMSTLLLMYICTKCSGKKILIVCCAVVCLCINVEPLCYQYIIPYVYPFGDYADEKNFYYNRLGALPMLEGFVNGIDTTAQSCNFTDVETSIERGYEGNMLSWAGGVYVYKYNEQLYMSDIYGLGDPLLSKLPAVSTDDWRIGHMVRKIPEGYKETLILGENVITDESLHEYYDILTEITRGPLFSTSRLEKLVNMLSGEYDYLIDEYLENLETKTRFVYKPYSEGFEYEGQLIEDYVRLKGEGRSALNAEIILPEGVYTIKLKYTFKETNEEVKMENTEFVVWGNENMPLKNTLSSQRQACEINDVGVGENGILKFSITLDKDEVLDVKEVCAEKQE